MLTSCSCLLLAERIPPQIIFTTVGNPLSFPIVSYNSKVFSAAACRLFTIPVTVVKFASIEPLVFQIVLVIPQAYPASFAVVNGIDSVHFWLTVSFNQGCTLFRAILLSLGPRHSRVTSEKTRIVLQLPGIWTLATFEEKKKNLF